MKALIWCAVSSRAQNEPEKISLPQQEQDARDVCQKNDWQIVDVLRVPGHSRRYIDFHELARDASGQGIDAFHKLTSHWAARDFDVLIVRDGDRFARTQALHAYVVERTIEMRARIFSLQDGWVDERNYRMWIAMGGYKAAGDIDRLVRSRRDSMRARAQGGLPTSSRIPISHVLIRNPDNGRAMHLEVNESKRRLWDDLAALVVEGVAWQHLETELFNRFGHVHDKTGKKYHAHYMYSLIMKPVFWGHVALNHNSASSLNGYKKGGWIFDESEPIPQGATVFRNTHPPVWTGEVAEAVKAEIRRRKEVTRGRATSHQTHRFSGLCVCAECGSFMATHTDEGYRGLICPAGKVRTSAKLPDCNNYKIINERKVIARMSDYLRQMLELNSTDVFELLSFKDQDLSGRHERLAQDIEDLENQARALIRLQAAAGSELESLYAAELAQIEVRLKNMRAAHAQMLSRDVFEQQQIRVQHDTLESLAAMTIDMFWKQESRYINQMLHRLMGKRRLLGLKGELVGVATVNRRQRRHA